MNISEIKRRLEAATPGKWIAVPNNLWETMYRIDGITHIEGIKRKDADLIAHAPTDIALLLKAVEIYKEAIEERIYLGCDCDISLCYLHAALAAVEKLGE